MTALGWVHDPLWFVVGLVCAAAVANLVGLLVAAIARRRGHDLGHLYAWSVAVVVALTVALTGVSALVLVVLKKGLLIVVVSGVWWIPLAGFLSAAVVRRRTEVPFWSALALGSLGAGAWISILIATVYGVEATSLTLLGGRLLLLVVAGVAAVVVGVHIRRLPAHRSLTMPRRLVAVAVVVGFALVFSSAFLFPQAPVGTSFPAQPSPVTNETAAAHAAAYEEVQILSHGAPGTARCRGRPLADSTAADMVGLPWLPNGSAIHYARVDCNTQEDPFPHFGEDGWTRSYSKLYFVNETITEDVCQDGTHSQRCPVEYRYQ